MRHTGEQAAPVGPQTDEFEHTVTVFTPTYNRAATLPRVYESLREQTCQDFEWLIVDDDSDDETHSLVDGWQAEADFPITLHVQQRHGKHRAHNIALERGSGRFFLIQDSDDLLNPTALERFAELWDEIPSERRDEVLGVNALYTDQHGEIVGNRFSKDRTFASHLEELYGSNRGGDRVTFDRTAVLRAYPFPDVEGVRYLPESIVWGEIALDGYVRYCVNEPLATYVDREPDRGDQLTQDSTAEHAPAFYLWHTTRLNDHFEWFSTAPVTFVESAAAVTKHGRLSGESFRQQWRALDGLKQRLLWLVAIPIGVLAAYRARNRSARQQQ